ncbi:MAG: NYN domain-containing protein [Chloroflexota bacterium]|nr:NYN domain-containing protein [Chloroflexota bacterium]MDE2894691.1 NYN domain-containing protein [Chloroflexota bacterium]
MAQRVALFIDWQNLHARARESFHAAPSAGRSTDGQIDPVGLGHLLCTRTPPGVSRELTTVRVYCGVADPHRNRTMFMARRNQIARWRRDSAEVITRPLQYLWDAQGQMNIAREKGIDVAIAVDFVTMAFRGEFDVGVLFSADTDLRPALEYVAHNHSDISVEVAAWRSGRQARRLNFDAPYAVWCHYFDASDYESLRDLTDYRPRR